MERLKKTKKGENVKTKQQEETLSYFSEHAQDYDRKTQTKLADRANLITQRNGYVLMVIDEKEKVNRILDIGCGPGDLICSAAKKGINGVGIDFAKEMIEIAERTARKLKYEKAKFECCSIFNFHFEPDAYNVISANGLIEYLSHEELGKLLDLSLKSLKKDGSLILSVRNRLFNIFSFNKFTEEEIEKNNIIALLAEAIQIVDADDISKLIGLPTAPLQESAKEHTLTGIKVSTRFQFTPVQMINLLKDKGFEPVEIYPMHIHGSCPKFTNEYPNIHGNIANLLQKYAKDNRCLIPNSSSFSIHGKKR